MPFQLHDRKNNNWFNFAGKILSLDFAERVIDSNDWASYLLAACFLLLACSRYFYPRRFEEFLLLPISDKFINIRGKEDSIYHPFALMLFVIQGICVSVFIYLLFRNFNPVEVQRNPFLFVQICTGYTIFVFIKFSIEKILASIFSIDAIVDQYLFQKLSYRNYLGLALFTGNILFLYSLSATRAALILFAAIVILFNVVALLSTYKRGRKIIVPNFLHFILYLCALEITPYIILYKVFF